MVATAELFTTKDCSYHNRTEETYQSPSVYTNVCRSIFGNFLVTRWHDYGLVGIIISSVFCIYNKVALENGSLIVWNGIYMVILCAQKALAGNAKDNWKLLYVVFIILLLL